MGENRSLSNGQEGNVPKLRFPGFEGEWGVFRLSDFVDRVTRKNTDNETNLPLTISSKDGLVDQISYFNKTVASKDMSGYYLLKNGEFAYNKSYSVGYDFGSVKRLDRYPMGALSTLYICFMLKKHDSDFIKVYFDSLKWYKEIYKISAEGARNHGLLNVPTDEFFSTKHNLPENVQEQRKIADFINLLNRRIETQQLLLETIKKYKRGLLSAIFPKRGKAIPKYRLSGFTEPWEQCRLGELVQIERGGSPRPINDYITDSPNGLNWVKIGDAPTQGLYITKTAEKIRPEGLSKTREVHPGDLILSNSMSFGKPYIMRIDGCIHDGWLLIRDKYKVFDLVFLCHMLSTPHMLNQYKSLAAGSTVNNLNKELVGNTVVTIPEINEQRILGTFLEQVDCLITFHQHKLDMFNKTKSSLIQQLFI